MRRRSLRHSLGPHCQQLFFLGSRFTSTQRPTKRTAPADCAYKIPKHTDAIDFIQVVPWVCAVAVFQENVDAAPRAFYCKHVLLVLGRHTAGEAGDLVQRGTAVCDAPSCARSERKSKIWSTK